jgi:hypothetical protein
MGGSHCSCILTGRHSRSSGQVTFFIHHPDPRAKMQFTHANHDITIYPNEGIFIRRYEGTSVHNPYLRIRHGEVPGPAEESQSWTVGKSGGLESMSWFVT